MKRVLATGAVFLAILLQTSCSDSDLWPQDRFESTKWRSAKADQRYRMVNDLIDHRVLVGLTSDKLERVLGPPGSRNPESGDYTYIVKLGGPGFNQVHILDVGFDAAT